MPTFKFNAVYSAVGDNLRYIADVEKQIPDSDVLKVMAYVNGEHAETIYARAYHCSSNPVLAAEEFLADRGKYFICHNRKKQSEKCCGKKEILAHHVYISCHEDDPVTPELLMKIADDFIKRMSLEDFRIFVSPHLNTPRKHFHMSICAYSMDGKRKFHMKNNVRYRCEIELNKIAASYGLSIIDDFKLRRWAEHNMPEYIDWLDAIKKERKIIIHENISMEEKIRRSEERKKLNANRRKNRGIKEESVEKQIKAAVRENTCRDVYEIKEYYTAEGLFPNIRKDSRPYRVRIWTETGRKRGTLELLFLLVATVFIDTEKYVRENRYDRSKAEPAKEIQKMIENIHRAKVYHIENLQDLKNKTTEVGSWLGTHKKAMSYIEKRRVENDDKELQEAWKHHKEQYELYCRMYRDLMLVKEAMREVVRDQYKCNIYEFEPTVEKKMERKPLLDEIIDYAEKYSSGKKVRLEHGIEWDER